MRGEAIKPESPALVTPRGLPCGAGEVRGNRCTCDRCGQSWPCDAGGTCTGEECRTPDEDGAPCGGTVAARYTIHRRYMHYYVMRGGEMLGKFVWESDAQAMVNKLTTRSREVG